MTNQQTGREAFSPEAIAAFRHEKGNGMESAVGEYTPPEFWDALDEIERLQAALTARAQQDDACPSCHRAWGEHRSGYSASRCKQKPAPKQQAVDEVMLSHIAAVIDGTLAHCISDSTTEERMYVGEQCLNELASIRAALLAALTQPEVE